MIGGEHDAVVRGAPTDMVPTRRQPKAQPLVAAAGVLEVAHPDDGVVDAQDVPHLRAPIFTGTGLTSTRDVEPAFVRGPI
jgi:hypothetical protein